jgi:GT2 family glycosyltransferase
MAKSVGVIIVTHNSSRFFSKCLAALAGQTVRPAVISVIDSGSCDTAYLNVPEALQPYHLEVCSNVGFCAANNRGWLQCRGCDYVLLLNPDAFLVPRFIEEALAFMERVENARVGALTGALLGYDIDAEQPTMLIDSTGIQQNWFGRLQDRDQRRPVERLERYTAPEEVTAICGALMFCRNEALLQASPDGELFDPEFFMYKEDIDLCWRIRKQGWRIVFDVSLRAYHCRGWKSRERVSKAARVLSSRNELRLFRKHRSLYLIYAALKFPLVRIAGI